MERGKKAVEELGSGRELSPLRESRLLVVKKAGEEARKTFIEANLGLVVTTAKKYARRMELEDRIQEGNCGLIMAVDKFDWRRGCKFSTYATWWIRQAVTRAISDRARVIRIPTHALEDISRYVKTYDSLRATLGREPGAEEIANAMGITTKRVRELAFWQSVEPGSLDMSVGEDGDGALADFVEDSASSPEEEFGRLADREWVRLLLQDIPPRIKRILEMRYGQGMTLEHIAREEGITRERVRQIIARAEGRLR
ncbi:MAG: sigma-70 family RNA polymerase sigma factor, partial [Candidatus Blackburnbacteria bacterium]|nr:sigma-70 family RNA polymerase sigma factor [Candidatus Blackburnbacteria bacterium]